MKYYILRSDSDPKVLGVSNGIKQAEIRKDGFENKEEYERLMEILGTNEYWNYVDTVQNLEFNIENVELIKGANLTDFLQFGPHLFWCPFLISEAVKEILIRFNLSGIKFWPAKVVKNRQKFNYYLLHINIIPNNAIDFKRSTFYVGNSLNGRKYYQFENLGEFQVFKKQNQFLNFDQIYASSSFDQSLDFFELSNSEILISSRLRNALAENFSSGIRLLPAFGHDGEWLKFNF